MSRKSIALEYGDVNTPVCWYNQSSIDPEAEHSHKMFANIGPCKFPWQVPCGIITGESESGGNWKRVLMDGGIWISSDNVMPSIENIDSIDAIVGRRVYFEEDTYVVDNYLAEAFWLSDNGVVRGRFPGSATVGYISAYRAVNDE